MKFVVDTESTLVTRLRAGDLFIGPHPVHGHPELFRMYECVPTMDGQRVAVIVDTINANGWQGRNVIMAHLGVRVDKLTGTRLGETKRTDTEDVELCQCPDRRRRRARGWEHEAFCPLYAADPNPPAATFCVECGSRLPTHRPGCATSTPLVDVDALKTGAGRYLAAVMDAVGPTTGSQAEWRHPLDQLADELEAREAAAERPVVSTFDPDGEAVDEPDADAELAVYQETMAAADDTGGASCACPTPFGGAQKGPHHFDTCALYVALEIPEQRPGEPGFALGTRTDHEGGGYSR